ncbi:MAG TPA: ABC transporter ATP-binding protein [Cellulomonas sp.]
MSTAPPPTTTAPPGPSARPVPPRIELDGIRMSYRTPARRGRPATELVAIERVDLVAEQNAFVSVIGPSGCGKSSLLKVISRVVGTAGGSVRIDGEPIADVDLTGRLSFMFQQPLLLPWRTVLDNVLLPVQVLRRTRPAAGRAEAVRLLEAVGLGQVLDQHPAQLSGGMRQRVALARALVTAPEILLMDEPFGAVDEITRETLQEQLLQVWQETRTTIVLVTHQIEEAVLLSDSVVVMSAGPGTVLEVIDVDLPRPRDADVRRTPEFHRLVDHLRDLLRPGTGTAGPTTPGGEPR